MDRQLSAGRGLDSSRPGRGKHTILVSIHSNRFFLSYSEHSSEIVFMNELGSDWKNIAMMQRVYRNLNRSFSSIFLLSFISATIMRAFTEYWVQVQPDGLAVLNQAGAAAIVSTPYI